MADQPKDPFRDGFKAARGAIANGVPRWIATEIYQFGELIHPQTGLPLTTISAPPELMQWRNAIVRGHNEEILRAFEGGEISVDFRPLVMSLDEVKEAFTRESLGILSIGSPQIDDPNGRFSLYVQIPKRKLAAKTKPAHSRRTIWIGYQPVDGAPARQFMLYSAPTEVALGRERRVLLFKTERLYLARDVETTQPLCRFLIR